MSANWGEEIASILLELSRCRPRRRVASASAVAPGGAADGERRRVGALILVLVSRRPDKVGVVSRDDVRDAVGEREGVPSLKVVVGIEGVAAADEPRLSLGLSL